MMAATRLLAGEGRCRDENGRFAQVQLFGGAGRQSVVNVSQCRKALTQATRVPVDPALLPHHRADGIGCNLRRTTIWKRRH